MNRRRFLRNTSMATAAILVSPYAQAWPPGNDFPVVRVAPGQRKFTSKAVEKVIADIRKNIGNKELAWMFENCFPNTLDTTVHLDTIDGKPDTYVITGDIDAMWLRDSSAQVWPYLPLCKEDAELKLLIQGVINRQTRCILKDPYANAFYKDEKKVSEWASDLTDMKPGIHERKWEIDSLCYPIRLAYCYWKATGDMTPFDEQWAEAMRLVIKTFQEQQRLHDKGPYHFMRRTEYATDSVPLGGYGYPVKPTGMICSMFRPSDDATVFPYLVPSNIFAMVSLLQLTELMITSHQAKDNEGSGIYKLIRQIDDAIKQYGIVETPSHGKIYAYETNGYGSHNLMDDANVPSLLSLKYLAPKIAEDPIYQHTRKFVLSDQNPFFFKGAAGEGIGGPHVGMDYIWPISIAMRGLTSDSDAEIKQCLDLLQHSHAGTGFMHEAFHKDDAKKFTRPWFAWANTLFGELVWQTYRTKPGLLS